MARAQLFIPLTAADVEKFVSVSTLERVTPLASVELIVLFWIDRLVLGLAIDSEVLEEENKHRTHRIAKKDLGVSCFTFLLRAPLQPTIHRNGKQYCVHCVLPTRSQWMLHRNNCGVGALLSVGLVTSVNRYSLCRIRASCSPQWDATEGVNPAPSSVAARFKC